MYLQELIRQVGIHGSQQTASAQSNVDYRLRFPLRNWDEICGASRFLPSALISINVQDFMLVYTRIVQL